MWNVFNYLISKENVLCRFSMHFANLWLLIMLALRGVWLISCFIHNIALYFLFFITTSVLGEGMLLSNNTFITSYLVSGGIRTGYDCLSFIPLVLDGNQLIIHSFIAFFFRHGASQIQNSRNGHYCILIKVPKFSFWSRDLKKCIINLEKYFTLPLPYPPNLEYSGLW